MVCNICTFLVSWVTSELLVGRSPSFLTGIHDFSEHLLVVLIADLLNLLGVAHNLLEVWIQLLHLLIKETLESLLQLSLIGLPDSGDLLQRTVVDLDRGGLNSGDTE